MNSTNLVSRLAYFGRCGDSTPALGDACSPGARLREAAVFCAAYDPPIAQLEDKIAVRQRTRPVRNDQDGSVRPQQLQRLGDLAFRSSIQRTGRLVKDQKRCVPIQSTRN